MKIVFTPDWFRGEDVLIDGFSFLVLLTFFIFCFKYYKMSKKKNILFLGIGFASIALAQLAVVITKFPIYYDTSFTQQIGHMMVTYEVVKSVDILYQVGFFFQRAFTLLGFYLIYKLQKKSVSEDFFLSIYFILILSLISAQFSYLFHLTILIFLCLIISDYAKIYQKSRAENTRTLIFAFSLLALSELIFIFSKLSVMFVTANVLELISYTILLLLIIKILKAKPKTL